ncbi:agamous-like MADS-box protein AGL80 [Trifolium pratense]|uniref:agamous-like MADS-box protein AGL80 n=1 Tax=Trifolium pratense TaxID=57577 RepID=UPI001E6956ED|nr:agamous-like MADS-box protein AGL80 [Trifolium pratense]
MKKLNEISTLFGIDACTIIYDQNNPQAEVWPSDSGVKSVLFRFGSLPEFARSKKMVDQEAFLRESIEKACDQWKKQREVTRKKEMVNIVDHYIRSGEFNSNLMSNDDLNDFSSFIHDNYLKEIDRKMKGMQIETQEPVRNGGDVMNGTEEREIIGHAQGLVSAGEDHIGNMGQREPRQ